MKALAYDTETTGLPLWNEPSSDPRQPHIVQIAATLFDDETWDVYASIGLVVKPDDWEIPAEVAKIHGINTEHASAVGVPEPVALASLMALWRCSDYRLGHNESFDARMVRIALKRFYPDQADEWKSGEAHCTSNLSRDLINLAPTSAMLAAGRSHPKTPKLSEAYEFFIGKPLEGAHSALVDVDACIAVYRAMREAA